MSWITFYPSIILVLCQGSGFWCSVKKLESNLNCKYIKITVYYRRLSQLGGVVESIRTVFEKMNKYVYIPDLR